MVKIRCLFVLIFVSVFLNYVTSDSDGILLPGFDDLDTAQPNKRIPGIFQSVEKRYECHVDHVTNEELLLYGTKSWTFPIQDVNLTLRYPSENVQDRRDYLVTGVTVILNLDCAHTRGFKKSGGILKDNIELTFLVKNTSRLSYRFWLYGVDKKTVNMTSFYEYNGLC